MERSIQQQTMMCFVYTFSSERDWQMQHPPKEKERNRIEEHLEMHVKQIWNRFTELNSIAWI